MAVLAVAAAEAFVLEAGRGACGPPGDEGRRGADRPSETAKTLGLPCAWSWETPAGRGRLAAWRRASAAAARAREATRVAATMAFGRKPLGANVVVKATRPR